MQKIVVSILVKAAFLILPLVAFSQTKFKLTGTVSDSSKPMALVTVRLFKPNNTTAIQTTISAENGTWQFNKPDTGNYILSFNHTGFAEKRVPVNIATKDGDIQIETVQLSRATGLLKEVVVKS
jgi:hypothetical protein